MVVELFPHQQEAVNWMRDHHRTALFFSVGLGKTLPAIEAAVAPVLVVCPRHLRYMWETELQRYDCRVAVIEGTADQRFAMLNTLDDTWATIVNYEMVRLGPASSIPNAKFPQLFKKHWGTVIFDECFPYETMVATEEGQQTIGSLVENPRDLRVWTKTKGSEFGLRQITRFIKKLAPSVLCRISVEGHTLVCTPNHKIWSETRGDYVEAEKIAVGERVCVVWENDYSDTKTPATKVLRSRLRPRRPSAKAEAQYSHISGLNGNQKTLRIEANERNQPNAEPCREASNGRQLDRQSVSVEAGRQWATFTDPTSHTTVSVRRDLALRGSGEDRLQQARGQSQQVPPLLQVGPSFSGPQARSRDKRTLAQHIEGKGARREEAGAFNVARVDSVVLYEQRGNGEHGGSYVYNLEVDVDHNYIADGIVVGNCHRLRGRNAGWTKAARKLRTERLVMLTGTPHVKNWGDVWPLLRLIDKRQFSSYHHFVDTYLRTFVTPYGKDIGDPLDPAQFGDMLNRYVLRHTYESAGWPRPQYVEHDIPCELTSTTRQKMQAARDSYWVYRQRIEGFDVQGDPTYVNEYVPVSSAAMLALEMRMHIAHDPLKQEALLDLVADIFDRDCNAGIIVWTYYQEAAQVVYAALAKIYNAKVRPQYLHLVTGGVPDKERTAAVAQFKAHGGILVATLGALSEGENLQRATSQVFYECDYRGTVNQQAIGRSARTGQTEIVTVYNLVARRSPDERVLKVARHRTEAGQSPWKEIIGE